MMLVRRRGEELSVLNQRLISFGSSDSLGLGEMERGMGIGEERASKG